MGRSLSSRQDRPTEQVPRLHIAHSRMAPRKLVSKKRKQQKDHWCQSILHTENSAACPAGPELSSKRLFKKCSFNPISPSRSALVLSFLLHCQYSEQCDYRCEQLGLASVNLFQQGRKEKHKLGTVGFVGLFISRCIMCPVLICNPLR